MASLESAAKYLSERGLSVTFRKGTLYVGREMDVSLELSITPHGYRLVHWECAPGPRQDEFDMAVADLDELLLFAWAFYFAKPVQMDGWWVPLHRFPFWTFTGFQFALSNATRVSEARLQELATLRRARAEASLPPTASRLQLAECSQFIQAGTRRDSSTRLFMRRDLAESFVVCGQDSL